MRTFIFALALTLAQLASSSVDRRSPKRPHLNADIVNRHWRQIGLTSRRDPVLIDPMSIETVQGVVHASVRVTFVKPAQLPAGKVRSVRASAMFDCARKTVAVTESWFYLDQPTGASPQHAVNAKAGFVAASYGSFEDVALKHICTT